MTTAANFIDFTSGSYDLPFALVLQKNSRELGSFDTRSEAEAFIKHGDYILIREHRANDGLPKTVPGFGTIEPFEQDYYILTVKHSDPELNLTVNEKVHTLLAKKGKPARSSSENRFRKALEQLVADWQAESLEENGPKYADFKDTKVVGTIGTYRRTYTGIGLTFDGSGYDYLSASRDIKIESYRNALQALCDVHGWSFEDCTSWAITFYRN